MLMIGEGDGSRVEVAREHSDVYCKLMEIPSGSGQVTNQLDNIHTIAFKDEDV